jgi:predicted nucleotidyltransferase
MRIPESVYKFLRNITEKYPRIESMWVFGSRANNEFKNDSDWDLWIFSNRQVFDLLKKNDSLRKDSREHKIDTFVVYDGENFEGPWPKIKNGKKILKSGVLSEWKWKKLSSRKAKYEGTRLKYRKGSDDKKSLYIEQKIFDAFKIWGHEEKHPIWYCDVVEGH